MARLANFKLLSFDVYGTLVDHDSGIIKALEPSLRASENPSIDPKHILRVYTSLVSAQQSQYPKQKYAESLTAIHPKLCNQLGLQAPTEEESRHFGQSVGDWPAFPDTVEALKRLSRYYKLVVLSNVDNESFKKCNITALGGFKFDAWYTAEDIGSYKPDPRNFEYMLKHVGETFGVQKSNILQVAQSQFHDHHPAKALGIKSVWIYRPDSILGNRDDPVFDWKFDTLEELADAVEIDVQASKE